MNQAIFNPWAQPYQNGFNNVSPDGCEEVDAAYVWPPGGGFESLIANEQRLGEIIILEQEDEFIWRAFQWALDGEVQPGFLYRVQDDQGNWISDDLILSFCTPGTPANPFPIFPQVTYRRGQQIKFDIVNAASVTQGFQLTFRGSKRYWGKA